MGLNPKEYFALPISQPTTENIDCNVIGNVIVICVLPSFRIDCQQNTIELLTNG